jgi:integrase
MALLKKANTYYAYFRDIDGRQIKRSLRTDNLEVAKLRERILRDAIREAKFRVTVEKFTDPDKIPATTAFPKKAPVAGEHQRGGIALSKMWDLAMTRRELSRSHKSAWNAFLGFVKVKYADEVTPKIALQFLESKYSGGNGKTFNNNKTYLNTIFRQCLIEAGLSESPFAVIPNRRIKTVEHHRPLTDAEFTAAFKAAKEPWKTASLISWYTALRKETCFRLTWEHINVEDRSITIMPGKTARFGRAVYIPIHRQLWEHLCSLPRPKSDDKPILSVFPRPGHRYSMESSLSYFSGLLRKLGINDTADGKASFHSIRASFITQCDEANVSRRATKGVAGQVSDDVTDLYSHDKESAKQILNLPELEL